jgi:hypothetical protein
MIMAKMKSKPIFIFLLISLTGMPSYLYEQQKNLDDLRASLDTAIKRNNSREKQFPLLKHQVSSVTLALIPIAKDLMAKILSRS